MTRIILLDIDGVLVQPKGYRAALRDTIKFFTGRSHVCEDDLIALESRGVTSEWDMVPLIIAADWDAFLELKPIKGLSSEVAVAARQIRDAFGTPSIPKVGLPDFPLISGQYPSEAAFQAGCFQSIPSELRKNLLIDTRNIHLSRTMQIFQHFTLGSRHFEKTYQLRSEFLVESYLLKYDRPYLDDIHRSILFKPGTFSVGFTARPSGGPKSIAGSIVGYAPEAELALELVGLPNLPLIAFGHLEYLASKLGINPATLVKPSPFHALAAILSAWTKDESNGLLEAFTICTTNKRSGRMKDFPSVFDIIVIEDTMSGIDSAREASRLLESHGFKIDFLSIGVTQGSSEKKKIFQKNRIPTVANWGDLWEILNSADIAEQLY